MLGVVSVADRPLAPGALSTVSACGPIVGSRLRLHCRRRSRSGGPPVSSSQICRAINISNWRQLLSGQSGAEGRLRGGSSSEITRTPPKVGQSHLLPKGRGLKNIQRHPCVRVQASESENRSEGVGTTQQRQEESTFGRNGGDGELSGDGLPPSLLPTDMVAWGGSLPSPRRLLLGSLLGLSVALGGNLGGLTSGLLGINPEVSRSLHADLLFPVQGYKRCVESGTGFEFIYPASWVGDQTLLYRAVERAERQRSLDLPAIGSIQSGRARRDPLEPLVAYGPPGTTGELNVSVVVAPVAPGFTLERLGTPRIAGELVLANVIAPPGSGKVATLLNATTRQDPSEGPGAAPVVYYTLEYTVEGASFSRHNLAVYTTVDGQLYTLNAQAARATWPAYQQNFEAVAQSFHVTGPAGSKLSSAEFAQRL